MSYKESGQIVTRPTGVRVEVLGGGISNTIRTVSESFQVIVEIYETDTDQRNG